MKCNVRLLFGFVDVEFVFQDAVEGREVGGKGLAEFLRVVFFTLAYFVAVVSYGVSNYFGVEILLMTDCDFVSCRNYKNSANKGNGCSNESFILNYFHRAPFK